MLSLRVSRDKRGYDHIYLLYESRRKGRPVTRLVYGGRWPSPMRVGQPPLDEATRRALEQAHPEITFDWNALQRTLQQALSVSRAPALPERRRRPGAGPAPGGPIGAGPSEASARSRTGGRGGGPPARPSAAPPRPGQRTPGSGYQGQGYQGPDRRQAPGQRPPYAPAAAARGFTDFPESAETHPALADETIETFGIPTASEQGDEVQPYETPVIEEGADFERVYDRAGDLDPVLEGALDPSTAFDEALVAGQQPEIDVEVEQTFVVVADGDREVAADTDDGDEVEESDEADYANAPDESAAGVVEAVSEQMARPAADPWSAVMTSLQEQAPSSSAPGDLPDLPDLPPSGFDLPSSRLDASAPASAAASGQPAHPDAAAHAAADSGDQPRRRRRRRRGGRRGHGEQRPFGQESAANATAEPARGDDADAHDEGREESDD